jgi:ribose/xylose/arabinose/galactoside ABC-type transport system permease subunit
VTAPAAPRSAPKPKAALWLRLLSSEYWVLGLCVAYFGVVAAILPDIASPENMANILSNMLPLLAVALGQTFVLITGGIDLSVTSIIALCSVTGAAVASGKVGVLGGNPALLVPAAIVLMLLIGAGLGLVNGLTITRLAMPPFMVTLTFMMFLSGFAIWATSSKPIHGLPDTFTAIGKGSLFDVVPYALFVVGAVAALGHVLLTRTVFGRWLFAVGGNTKTARISGVPVPRTIVLAYLASGLCAAVASVLYTGRLETGSPVLGQRIFLDVIGAAVIGGTSLFGGKGSVLGTVFGVLFIAVIDNSFNLLGFSSFVVLIAKGTVILLAALLDAIRARLSART